MKHFVKGDRVRVGERIGTVVSFIERDYEGRSRYTVEFDDATVSWCVPEIMEKICQQQC